jgi:hypothetical protein
MATSSRQSGLFGPNDWKAIYQTFREADFRSYDYETLRKSFIDYLRFYYPETFNDYTESSEYIALLDVMAFMGQGLAFRNDLNARENFIDTAERRDSVVKLANLVSYTPKRNLCSQGYLKVVSVTTTENVLDFNGLNLGNLPILWNDPANPNWLEQFNAILNATLISSQRIGRPGNISDILGVITSEYTMKIPNSSLPIVPFNSTVDGITMPFELVSVSSIESLEVEPNIYELPPAPSGKFNFLYRNDGLGFASGNTGFYFYFKQGVLQSVDFNLPNQIANQTVPIDIQGVNNSDTWLYQTNASNNSNVLWRKVDNVYANAYLQNENSRRQIYSVNSRFNDQVTYVFGDGVFSEIPVGTFRAYVRSSNGLTYQIDPNEMQGINISFTYVSKNQRNETLTVGLALTSPVSNALARETILDIKQRAPTRYYTQNRMVNGEDYNNFPYTLYSSIIKSKAINRSSIGVSKNLDLLDPTGKYSSTNSFGSDGGIWQEEDPAILSFTINSVDDIIDFLTTELAAELGSTKSNQYYLQHYPRYDINSASGDGTLYWNTSIVDANTINGYFYNVVGAANIPAPVGNFSSYNAKYINKGALLKFIAPPGYYFDNNNRLIYGLPTASSKTFIWITVANVVGDGNNEGRGNFSNGTGPVTLNGYVPSGCILTQVIPTFSNVLPANVQQEIRIRTSTAQNFTLVYDNSQASNQERWSVKAFTNANWFVKFIAGTAGKYTVEVRNLTYYFGSVAQTRFTFSPNELVYDPFSGTIIQDFVNVLAINSQPNTTNSLGRDYKVNILGQTIESDGYVNDFEVVVASTDTNNSQIITNPDFFNELTGYVIGGTNTGIYAFFEIIEDAISLQRLQLLPTSDVNYNYTTKTAIDLVKYEYPVGQLFYATSENVFYTTVQDQTVNTPSYNLIIQPQYLMKPGRQGLSYQYRHNSNNTTRIDPATTNIIDLYVVTQAYYTNYNNWIIDNTNTLVEPALPTITELNTEYSKVQDYKMLSDSVVLNSVVFKPLFGPKAAPALRGTIKVVKVKNTSASDSEIRSAVLTAMNNYFDINNWNFGETFYFTELASYLHNEVGELISSAVLVPNDPTKPFGDLYEIKCRPFEIFVNAATANDVIVVPALTQAELQVA